MNYPLEVLTDQYTILRLAADAPVPPFVLDTFVWSITRTDRELSILCSSDCIPADFAPDAFKRADGYRAIRIAGTLDFSEIGILAQLLNVLAEAKISVLTLSTFDTDYIFVENDKLDSTLIALRDGGYQVQE